MSSVPAIVKASGVKISFYIRRYCHYLALTDVHVIKELLVVKSVKRVGRVDGLCFHGYILDVFDTGSGFRTCRATGNGFPRL